ncbi:MAG: peptidylprolyl isomerase [Thermoguttaceae bacterium]|nr:peptidylprolyl isomerase [Thermoguttaceae bacterium]
MNTPFERDPAGPDARKHFRGSVVWAQTETEEQGNGQFFVMFTPAPQLDGKYTVFGRVTKGMDVVSSFRRTGPEVSETGKETAPPDRILSARVLNRPGY